jgi:hypothetical protein
MPINKSGSMGTEAVTNVMQPIRKYAFNLDDLEDVKGFDKSGKKEGLYCFKLTEDNNYIRSELPPGVDNQGIENKPLMFIYEDNKWIPIPTKYEWDIDIKLKPKTFSRKNNLMTIINSGTIIANLISLPANELIGHAALWRRGIGKNYCVATLDKKEVHFEFLPEIAADKNIINMKLFHLYN